MAFPSITKMAWILPTPIAVLLAEISFHGGFSVPVPFLFIHTAVVISGLLGGQSVGITAGIIAAGFVGHAYFAQFGPASLTGGILQVGIGSALYIITGILLGRLRDQRDASTRELRAALLRETTEKERQSDKLAEGETRLNTATRIAGLGHFSFEAFTGNCTFCSEQHAANLGMTPEEFLAIAEGIGPQLPHVHPDDHSIVMDAIDRLNHGESQAFEFRVLRPNGGVRHIRQIEEPGFDQSGRVIEHTAATKSSAKASTSPSHRPAASYPPQSVVKCDDEAQSNP